MCNYRAFPIAKALDAGADVVITGRCVDSALALGPLIHKVQLMKYSNVSFFMWHCILSLVGRKQIMTCLLVEGIWYHYNNIHYQLDNMITVWRDI